MPVLYTSGTFGKMHISRYTDIPIRSMEHGSLNDFQVNMFWTSQHSTDKHIRCIIEEYLD